jgi:phenylpyruvate tautomerase PptA (4-oxalocrotonate tautomerase family)
MFYHCFCAKCSLTPQEKQRIAEGITEIHCNLLQTPRQFVHVIFSEYDRENAFSAGDPSRPSLIRGHLRGDRTQQQKDELLRKLSALWTTETGTHSQILLVSVAENSGAKAVESGVLLPHPKDNGSWGEYDSLT